MRSGGQSMTQQAGTLSMPAGDLRGLIEAHLEQLLAGAAGAPPHLHAAMRHALIAPSKRVRPLLAYLVAEPGPDLHRAALDLGAAVEMVHTASLILDDLPCMDDAQMRRQRPTTHVVFGQATAILAAIALLNRAFGILAELEPVPAPVKVRLAEILSHAIGWHGLVAGQELDVNARRELSNPADVEHLNWLKTGVLFVAVAEMSAVMAGFDDRRIEAVSRFARHLGLAFQTADDLIDRSASAAEAGKDVGKDAAKPTLVTLLGSENAKLSCEQHLRLADSALIESGVSPEPLRALVKKIFERPSPA